MIKEKKRAVAAFGLIFLFFFLALIYFLFTPGLRFAKMGDRLFIKNESIRSIRGIRIYDEHGQTIDCIAELGQENSANYRKEIFLPESETVEVIKASAAFHPEISTRVARSEEELGITLAFSEKNSAVVGGEYLFSVEACNMAEDFASVKLEEEHDLDFFQGGGKSVSFPLKKGDCRKAEFSLTPVARGRTVLGMVLTTPKVIKREETIIEIG